MIWIGIILVALGVCIQAFSNEKKLGKGLWISGLVILAISLIIILMAVGWTFFLMSSASML